MADDIDIEEHDVLDNPAIKDMFPDISVLKEEIRMFEEGARELVNNDKSDDKTTGAAGEIIDDDVILFESSLTDDVERKDFDTNSSEISALENSFNSNKIILGSKPTKKYEFEEEFFEQKVKSYTTHVVLDDLKPYLNTSGRFCNECLILFPNESALVTHNQIFHFVSNEIKSAKTKTSDSLEFAVKGFKCNKCNILYSSQSSLCKHNKIIHSRIAQAQTIQAMISKVKNNVKQKELKVNETCFHCNKSFPTQKSLIEHLYCILQPKSYNCEICSKKFSNREELNKHGVVHKVCVIAVEKLPDQLYHKTGETYENSEMGQSKQITSSPKKVPAAVLDSEKDISDPLKEAFKSYQCYRCYICSYNFIKSKYYLEHLVNKHNITKDCEEIVKEEFDSKCKYCSKTYNTIHSYNVHLLGSHKKYVSNQIQQEKPNNVKSYHSETELLNSGQARISSQCYRCHICSCNFLTTKFYLKHLANKHYIIIDRKEIEKEEFDGKCKYCSGNFNTIPSYNAHLYGSHKKHVNVRIKEQEKPNNIKAFNLKTDMINPGEAQASNQCYRCYICSYNFTQIKFCMEHLANKHNIKDCKEIEKEEFDSKCKYCSRNFNTLHTFNVHLLQSHSKHVYKNGNVVLKSAVFKCSKCDIHFLSAKVARNHLEHIEMLINWKCLICKNIFKVEDQYLHEKQHENSEEFLVHDLCPMTSSPVLYKCLKCTVHFDEEKILSHHSTCEIVTPNSVFCIICDILIDNSISKSHRSEHVSNNLKPTDFIIVRSDILEISNCIEGTSSSNKRKHEPLVKVNSESSNIPHKKKKHIDNLMNLTYCSRCKCFLTDIDHQEEHLVHRCQHLEKYICQICGLTLTAQSFEKAHRSIHTIKNVKLKDFNFYDLKSGKRILPPAPVFSKCENCNVHYLPNDANCSHECSETNYLTCHICNINLTENAFTLHMVFHNYSRPKFEAVQNNTLNKTNSQTKDVPKKIDKFISKKDKNWTEKVNGLKSNKCLDNSLTDIISQPAKRKSIKSPEKRNSKTDTKSVEKVVDVCKTKNKICQHPTSDDKKSSKLVTCEITEKVSIEQINLDGLLYQCSDCCLSVDTYDKVIEHCQEHYCDEKINRETVRCQICNITLDKISFNKHSELHSVHENKDFFTFLYFDTFYFTSENKIWIEHVFGTLPLKIRDKIIRDSVYKYECRIKMEVIQNGPSHLTVYKCDKCRSFIDGISIYKHAENSCFKLRRHPCSVCGLPFNSSVARIEHEKIHEEPNIDLKSYRIVTFNKEEDKASNKFIYARSQFYVFYQCRNCSVAYDKSQTKNHKCCQRNVKACSKCGLLFTNDNYDSHILRHNKLPNIVQKNIKVVLFGETIESNNEDDPNKIVSSFTGIVNDYTFYSCSKCQVCVKSNTNLENHTCYFGANRLKCSLCKLYFLTSRLKQHIKMHEIDPYFLRENMRVIIFNSSEDVSDNSAEVVTVEEDIEPATSSMEETPTSNEPDIKCNKGTDFVLSNTEENNHNVIRSWAKIYKCFCGLHFLDVLSFLFHFKVCDEKSRAVKEKCTKCDLLFTPDILFNHLILHHGDKSKIYQFNIIDLEKNNIVYRCVKCNLHFVMLSHINKHFSSCGEATKVAHFSICIFCNLKFEPSSFLTHYCSNVNNVNADIEVLNLAEPLVPKNNTCENKQEQIHSGTNSSTLPAEHIDNFLPKTNTSCENGQEQTHSGTISSTPPAVSVPSDTSCEKKQKQTHSGSISSTPQPKQLDQKAAVNVIVTNKHNNNYKPKRLLSYNKVNNAKTFQRNHYNQMRNDKHRMPPPWQRNPNRWSNNRGPRSRQPNRNASCPNGPWLVPSFDMRHPSSFEPQQPPSFDLQQSPWVNDPHQSSFDPQHHSFDPQHHSFDPQHQLSFDPHHSSFNPQHHSMFDSQHHLSFDPQQHPFGPQQILPFGFQYPQ